MEEIFPSITVREMPIDALPQLLKKKNKQTRRTHSSRLTANHFLEKFNILNHIAYVKETNLEIDVV